MAQADDDRRQARTGDPAAMAADEQPTTVLSASEIAAATGEAEPEALDAGEADAGVDETGPEGAAAPEPSAPGPEPTPEPAAAPPQAASPLTAQPAPDARTGPEPAAPARPAGRPQQVPPYATQWRPQLPTYGTWEDAHGAPASSGALRRAFAQVSAGDVVRDALAALALLLALQLPWDLRSFGWGRIEVVVVTFVALAGLLAAYLARAGAYADRLDAARAGRLRAWLAVPYLLVVVGFLVGDVVVGDRSEALGGVGSGLVVGLAGAVLTLAPRVAELRAPNRLDRAWLLVPGVIGGLAVVWVLGGLLAFTLDGGADRLSATALLVILLEVLVVPAALVLGVVGVLRRDEGWRLALVVLGAAPVVLALAAGGSSLLVASVHDLPDALVFWPAAAAAAAAPSARRAMRVTRARWADAAGRVLTVAVVAAAVEVVVGLLTIADTREQGLWIVLTVLALLALVVAIGGRTLLRDGVRVPLGLALAVAGVLLVLGALALLLVRGAESTVTSTVDLLLALAVPAALAGTLLAHASADARGALGHPAVPEAPAWAPPPAPAQGGPGDPEDPVAAAVRQAQDPTTPQVVLADLATRVPATRVHIARHPAAYPALLDWLAALGDPEVARAVAERRGG